jgi:hypothetical protein
MLTSEYFEVPAEGPVRQDLALAFAQEEVEAEILADD